MAITLDELHEGKRVRVSSSEFAKLRGCSQSTLSRERWNGRGVPYVRDAETGRIWYRAEDVLVYFSQPKHKSTSEYAHGTNERMERARFVRGGSNFFV